jgi:glycine/sarcosine N-methyltransferase
VGVARIGGATPTVAARASLGRGMADSARTSASESRPLFDSFAWAYDLVVAHPAGGPVDEVPRRLRSLDVPAGAVVVDAGCGTGRYAQALAEAGFCAVGVDRSSALIDQARARRTGATFVCADLLSWQPPECVAGVLCRGVLNDLVADRDRLGAFAAFAAWLCADGVLIADVRDWEATAARYATDRRRESSVQRAGRTLRFSSETELDAARHVMRVHERYVGMLDGVTAEENCEFLMRCWTVEEVRAHAAAAGFAALEIQRGSGAGVAADRLPLVARR